MGPKGTPCFHGLENRPGPPALVHGLRVCDNVPFGD